MIDITLITTSVNTVIGHLNSLPLLSYTSMPASMAQLDARPTVDQEVAG